MSDARAPMKGVRLGTLLSLAWTAILVCLAIGATTNLFVVTDIVQPYCSIGPDDFVGGESCKPCGLRWEMWGALGATQCPGSVFDELLTLFVAAPRLLFVIFGITWMLTVPVLVINFAALARRWLRSEQTRLDMIQIALIGYILLWTAIVGAVLLIPGL